MSLALAALAALVATVALSAASLQAQAPGTSNWADSAIKLIDQGSAAGKPEGFDPAIALMNRVLTVTPRDGVILHYKGYALYRKSNLLLSAGARKEDVKAVLEEADDALEQSAAVLQWPETPALRASVAGQMIGVSGMMSALRLGPKADGLMDDAVSLGPNNPRVFMLRGASAVYKPVAPAPSWGHAEAWAWLGQVYAREKQVDKARAAYQKALELQPDFGWVKYRLLPALDKVKR